MASRLKLHEEFCEILGNRNAYYDPPESVNLKYPGVKYSLDGVDQKKANDQLYMKTNRYKAILIDPDPESTLFEDVLARFRMCNLEQSYKADNLNHFVFTIYY